MNRKALFVPACIVVAALIGSLAIAEPAKEAPAGQPEMKLPPGWTAEDMQACMLAGTPGKMHKWLAKSVGAWNGESQMWMAPGGEPMKSKCTATMTPIMDGRYIKCEMSGDMPGMGPFTGLGINGFDNVSKKFVSSWVDNQSTGIMTGTGKLSEDGKTLTWNYTFNCPITRKPTIMREIERLVDDNKMTLEMYGSDPKSGKEYKMMAIEFTKKP